MGWNMLFGGIKLVVKKKFKVVRFVILFIVV